MYQKTVLDNGIRIITERVELSHLVSFGVWVDVGSRDETESEQGSSHFLEHMLFKGTSQRTARQIALELDMLGGMSNAFTSTENTCYYATVLDRHLPRIISLFADLLRNSSFDRQEIERERQVILQEIGLVEDTPDDLVHDYFATLLWGGHPLGKAVLGSREVVAGMTQELLTSYLARHYRPENIIITGAGNLEHERFVALWQQELEGFTGSSPGGARQAPQAGTAAHKLYRRKCEQAHVVLGSRGLAAAAPERYSLHLLNTVLGGNMSSRLFQEIREKRGLSYSVYSSLTSFSDGGQLSIYLGLEPTSVNEALRVVRHELDRLASEPLGQDELASVKDYVATSLHLASDNMENRMTHLARNELFFQRQVPVEELLSGIEAVTAEQVHSLAVRLFAEELTMVLVGPVKVKEVDWRLLRGC